MAEKPVICDSDVLIDYFNEKSKRNNDISNHFQEFENDHVPICISVVTKMELIQGAKDKKEVNGLIKRLTAFNTFYITEEISELAFNYIKDFSKSHSLQIPMP